MYEFDKGDLFIEISDPGDRFVFDDETQNIYISIGGVLRFTASKEMSESGVYQNMFVYYSADGNTVLTQSEIIDPETIGDNDE